MTPHLRILYTNLTREEAETYGLVLAASDLPGYRIKKEDSGWSLWVRDASYASSRLSIETYRAENPDHGYLPAPENPAPPKTYTTLWVCLILIAAYFAAGSGSAFRTMADMCGASAREILNGEIYRTATALMLHATPAHLAGNVAGMALFGTALCRITGPGVAWLMILLTGITGNLANAALFRSDHHSVGASTAVFGAVGILTAYQFYRKINVPGQRIKAWLPLAGGLALLGFLGAGRHTDIMAHLFGFVAGLVIGLAYTVGIGRPPESKFQVSCLVGAAGLLTFSWIWAYLNS